MPPRKNSKSKSRKKTRSDGSLLMKLGHFVLVAGLWCGIALALVIAWYAAELPGIIDDPHFERKYAVTVEALDGSTIARYGELKGMSVEVKDLPPDLIHAVLAIEDRRFYSHFGIDPIGIARAIVTNVTSKNVHGGSTITQQLAKNLFLTPERKLKRKIQEAILAVWLETQLTKDEILSAYLNRVYLGGGAFGVEAASRVYFAKSAKELNLRESATIAGLLKAPSRYSPQANPELSAKRAKTVLAAMKDAGYITDKDVKANSTSLDSERRPVEGNGERFYSDWIVSDLTGLTGELPSDMVVQTTMIPEIQAAAEAAIKRVLDESGEAKKASQAAVIVMAPGWVVTYTLSSRAIARRFLVEIRSFTTGVRCTRSLLQQVAHHARHLVRQIRQVDSLRPCSRSRVERRHHSGDEDRERVPVARLGFARDLLQRPQLVGECHQLRAAANDRVA